MQSAMSVKPKPSLVTAGMSQINTKTVESTKQIVVTSETPLKIAWFMTEKDKETFCPDKLD